MSGLTIGSDRRKLYDGLRTLPWTWMGVSNQLGPYFALAYDDICLHVRVVWRHPFDESRGTLGSFTAELWRSDVFELFVGGPDADETYSEFNFAPSGAWWFSHYTGYRRADSNFVVPACTATRNETESGVECLWTVALSPEQLQTMNAAGFVSSGTEGANRYLTWSNPIGETPDFHLRELRRPVVWA